MFQRLRSRDSASDINQCAKDVPAATASAGLTEAVERAAHAIAEGRFDAVPVGDCAITRAMHGLARSLRQRAAAELKASVDQSMGAIEETISALSINREAKAIHQHSDGIAAAAEELARTIAQIAENCQRADFDSKGSVEEAAQGLQQSADAAAHIQNIAETVSQAAEKVSLLSENSEKIGVIVSQIEAVAKQTNLLALNATIEAARAGEAGKGFAVVANEVKALANETAQATVDIRERIETLQQDMAEIVHSMGQSSTAVQGGQSAIGVLSERISAMSERATTTRQTVHEITTMLDQQLGASEDVSAQIQAVSQSAAANLGEIEHVVDLIDGATDAIMAKVNALMAQDIPAKTVIVAKMDHLLWRKRLAAMLIGRESLNPAELADHHQCRLGKWYDASRHSELAGDDKFRALEAPHRLVHAHGIQAAKYYTEGRLDAALTEIDKVSEASRDVIRLLDEIAGDIAAAEAA